MSRVKLLARDVAERIAAGEVIDRPASIVKELVENSLDAGATRIGVDLMDGGMESITVTDNGFGMSRDDLQMAIQRFATSKINAWDDLHRLESYGFRGEALPSIGAVARLSITSREVDAPWGWCIVVQGGDVVSLEEASAPVGTRVEVTRLFYNTPARRKFLKSAASEAVRCQDVVGAMAVAAPHVAVTFRHQGKTLLDLAVPPRRTPGPEQWMGRLRRLFGLSATTHFVPLESQERRGVQVSGCITGPGELWSNRRRLLVFVNRRLVTAPAVSFAVADGVGAARGRYPMGAVLVEVAAEAVDVNVHPTKAEVRFRDAEAVFTHVREAAVRAARGTSARPVEAAAGGFESGASRWREQAGDPFATWPEAVRHRVVARDDGIWLIDVAEWTRRHGLADVRGVSRLDERPADNGRRAARRLGAEEVERLIQDLQGFS